MSQSLQPHHVLRVAHSRVMTMSEWKAGSMGRSFDGPSPLRLFRNIFKRCSLLNLGVPGIFLFFELLKLDIGILHQTASICFNVFTARCRRPRPSEIVPTFQLPDLLNLSALLRPSLLAACSQFAGYKFSSITAVLPLHSIPRIRTADDDVARPHPPRCLLRRCQRFGMWRSQHMEH
jgi:hypothetical protein